MQSKAKTVTEYLDSLPPERQAPIRAVRQVILDNIDPRYAECMGYGMLGYAVPHSIYPAGYHCDPKQPLPFAGLASQKQYMSLYMMGLYGDPAREMRFRSAWAKTGKKLDMGKCCIRFRKVEDLALDVIAEAFREATVDRYIAHYERAIRTARKAKSAPAKAKKVAKPGAKAPAAKKKAAKKKVWKAR